MNNKKNKITVVITGGGTGGHIYPAIAVAQHLLEKEIAKEVHYIGCPKNMESEIASKENIPFYSINISGMPRKCPLSIINWIKELQKSVKEASAHLKKIKPDVIFGTGGYVSGPVLISAIILRIPFIIHDSDAHPGIVSRFISPWAKGVNLAFEDAKKFITSKNIQINGNPIRTSLQKITKINALNKLDLESNKPTLLVMGGSQGARAINTAILKSIKNLVEVHNFQVIHQTGSKNFTEYKKELLKAWPDYEQNPNYKIYPYFEDISIAYKVANLVVSRAGSLSISELNLMGLPSILVPYPYAAANHQKYNALAMQKAGAAIFLENKDCNTENLIELVAKLLNTPDELSKMKENSLKLAKPEAVDNIAKMILNCARKN